jgi:hypothetical protein
VEERRRKEERRVKNRIEKTKEVERRCIIGRKNICPKLGGSDHS